MKTFLITSAAALLVAGTATAGEIAVESDVGSKVRVIHVENYTMTPTAGPGDEGLLTADVVVNDDFGIPGFEADSVIYIWADERGVRITDRPNVN